MYTHTYTHSMYVCVSYILSVSVSVGNILWEILGTVPYKSLYLNFSPVTWASVFMCVLIAGFDK